MKIGKKEYSAGGSMKEMYASGGMLKALLKDPAQREMAKQIIAEMGAKVPEYEEGGATGEPEEEGKMIKGEPGEVRVQDLTSQEQKKLGLQDDREFRGKYENFHNMNLYSATSEDALKFFKLDEAKKLLKQKAGISVNADVSPEKVMQMAKTKGVLQDANIAAAKLFRDWGDDRAKNPKQYQASYAGVGGATRKKDAAGNPIMLR
jgi:TusA-related sulfurtransferase